MSKDYKGPAKKSGGGKGGAGSLLIGILIGLLMGLGIALAVAWYINKMPTPFVNRAPPPLKGEPLKSPDVAKSDDKTAKSADAKPRFDFYKILPGAEEPRIGADRKAADKAVERPVDKAGPDTIAKAGPPAGAVKPSDRIWLQAGAFASQSDAEALKARLALAGWEAAVQSATLPDQGVRYRVRVGPFDNTDEVNRVKGELSKSGFDAAVIKNQ